MATNPSYVALRRRLLLEGPTLDYFPANSDVLVPQVGSGVTLNFSRASTAKRWNHAGQLVTVAQNVPRIDYDPVTGRKKGLLIEESRTNLLLWSEEFDNPSWAKFALTISADATTAPDGTTTADKLVENSSTGLHVVRQFVTISAGATVAVSFFAKAGERTAIQAALFNNVFTSGAGVNFDLSAETTIVVESVNYTIVSRSITAIGGGWYRCAFVVATSTDTSVGLEFRLLSGGTNVYTGDGSSGAYIWGAQLEVGSFPTSYIKTEGSTATRAADICTISDISGFFNATEGTILVECLAEHTGTDRVALSVDDGTSSERMELRWSGIPDSAARFDVVDGGVSQVLIQPNASGAEVRRLALAYKANDFAVVVNGGTVSTDTSGTLPTVDRFLIGGATFAGGTLNGWVRRILYWPKRLPNDQLRTLTA